MAEHTEIVRQTLFTTGVVDPILWKRSDLEEYMTAAQAMTNMQTLTTGLARKRFGMQFLTSVTGVNGNSRIYEFKDKNGNFYALVSIPMAFYIYSIGANNVMTLIQTVTTPYLNADLPNLDYSQNSDVFVITNQLYPPARIYISDYTTMPPTFAYQVLNISPVPAYDFGNINYASATATFSNPTATTFSLTLNGAGVGAFTTAWIGGQVIGFGATPEQPIGYGIIQTVSAGGTTATFTGLVVIPFAAPANMPTLGSQYSVTQPAWNNTLGWPGKVLFYQNRLWLASTSTLPQTIFGSHINQFVNFDVGVGNDADAIVYTIGQSDSGSIIWMNGGKQLEIFTQNYEFACPQDQSIALTPSTFSIRQQSSYGVSVTVKPITYINDTYYVSKTGTFINNFHFNGIGQTYTSSNVSPQSQQLVQNPTDRAIIRGDSENQDNFIYYNNAAFITSFQFAHEYKLSALTPVIFNQPVVVYSLASINNQLFALKNYNLNGNSTIEGMSPTFYMDGWLTSTMASNGVITGLDQLDGYTVQVVFQFQDFGEYLVIGGQITVDNPNMYSGTVQVGILYDVVLTPMFYFAGAMNAPLYKVVTRIFVDYWLSLNFQVNGYQVPYQNFADIEAGLGLVPQSGTFEFYPVGGWQQFDTFSITQTSPFNLTITGIAYQVDLAII